jgi:hypothetical protein
MGAEYRSPGMMNVKIHQAKNSDVNASRVAEGTD